MKLVINEKKAKPVPLLPNAEERSARYANMIRVAGYAFCLLCFAAMVFLLLQYFVLGPSGIYGVTLSIPDLLNWIGGLDSRPILEPYEQLIRLYVGFAYVALYLIIGIPLIVTFVRVCKKMRPLFHFDYLDNDYLEGTRVLAGYTLSAYSFAVFIILLTFRFFHEGGDLSGVPILITLVGILLITVLFKDFYSNYDEKRNVLFIGNMLSNFWKIFFLIVLFILPDYLVSGADHALEQFPYQFEETFKAFLSDDPRANDIAIGVFIMYGITVLYGFRSYRLLRKILSFRVISEQEEVFDYIKGKMTFKNRDSRAMLKSSLKAMIVFTILYMLLSAFVICWFYNDRTFELSVDLFNLPHYLPPLVYCVIALIIDRKQDKYIKPVWDREEKAVPVENKAEGIDLTSGQTADKK